MATWLIPYFVLLGAAFGCYSVYLFHDTKANRAFIRAMQYDAIMNGTYKQHRAEYDRHHQNGKPWYRAWFVLFLTAIVWFLANQLYPVLNF